MASDVGKYCWICSMNVTRVLAARGTGADLSIHRLEPTVTQRPYTVVRTSPCSRNPFLTLRRPAKLPVPVQTSRVGVRAEPGALVYLPTSADTKDAWCSAMVYADRMSIQFPRRASTRSKMTRRVVANHRGPCRVQCCHTVKKDTEVMCRSYERS